MLNHNPPVKLPDANFFRTLQLVNCSGKFKMNVLLVTHDGSTLGTVPRLVTAEPGGFKPILLIARVDPAACNVKLFTNDSVTGSNSLLSCGITGRDEPFAPTRDSDAAAATLVVTFDVKASLSAASLLRFDVYPLHLAIRLRAPAATLLEVLAAAPQVAQVPDPRFGLSLHVLLRSPPFADMAAVVCALMIAAPSSVSALADTREGAVTALHLACANGSPLDVIELLLRPPDAVAAHLGSGPQLASRATTHGRLPVHEAARCAASPAVIRALLAAHPPAAAAVDLRGNTPLHCLLQRSRQCWPVPAESICDLIAAAPAAAETRNCLGLLPLHLAAACDAAGIAALLEANPHAAGDTGARGSPNRRFPLQRVLAAAASPRVLHPHAATPGVPLRLVRAILHACPPSARRWWRSPADALELPAGAACLAAPCRSDLLELLLEAGERSDADADPAAGREAQAEHVCGEPLDDEAAVDATSGCAAGTVDADSLRSYTVPHTQLVRRVVQVAKVADDLPERATAMENASASLAALIASARMRCALDSVPWSLLLGGERPWPANSIVAALRERALRRRFIILSARYRSRTEHLVQPTA